MYCFPCQMQHCFNKLLIETYSSVLCFALGGLGVVDNSIGFL